MTLKQRTARIWRHIAAAAGPCARRIALWLWTAIDFRDFFVFGGLGAVGYGLAEISPPVAWCVCGVALFWLGLRR